MEQVMSEFAAESQADRDAENLAENQEQDNFEAMSIPELVEVIKKNCKEIRENVATLAKIVDDFASRYENK